MAEVEKLKERSYSLCQNLLNFPVVQNAKTVLSYSSFGNELNTHWLNNQLMAQKNLLLPVISGNHLILRQVTEKTEFEKKPPFHIPEPFGPDFKELDQIDLVLVPCLAFDKKKNRLGKGKGYYDRLLNKMPRAYKLGICHDFQFLEELPTEAHDITMDEVMVAKND